MDTNIPIFVVRHGERADDAGIEESNKIVLEFDPHLTDFGKVQALFAGKQIKTLTNGIVTESKKILIISSPFLRCIQTAFQITQALDEKTIYENKIYVDNSICELLLLQYFKESPLQQLFIRAKTTEFQSLIPYQIQDGLILGHASTPTYPETYSDILSRFDLLLKLLEIIQQNMKIEEIGGIIIVTHGYGVQGILEGINEFDFLKGVEYTSISGLKYEKKSGTLALMFGQDHSHLKLAEDTIKGEKQS